MREEKDNSSKWLVEHHGNVLLQLGGVSGFTSWRAVHAERAHPRQLPDGLLEVTFPGKATPDLVVIEVATYPERRAEQQAIRDAALVWLDRDVLPDVVTLVLHPKGNFRIGGEWALASSHGLTRLSGTWMVIEMWTLSAEDLLAINDVGVIPWVPLAQTGEPPDTLLRRCRERIERQAPAAEKANLLAVTQVMAGLRYNDPSLLAILGGRDMAIESPVLDDLVKYVRQLSLQKAVLRVLQARFGPVPQDLEAQVKAVQEEERLLDLNTLAATCADLDAFRAQLPS